VWGSSIKESIMSQALAPCAQDRALKQAARLVLAITAAALAGCASDPAPVPAPPSANAKRTPTLPPDGEAVLLPNGQSATWVGCTDGEAACRQKLQTLCGSNGALGHAEIAHRYVVAPPVMNSLAQSELKGVAVTCVLDADSSFGRGTHVDTDTSADTNFDTDRATLRPEGTQRLDRLLESTRGTTFSAVAVLGYTDNTGHAAHNQSLSQARAQSVANYLKQHGLQAKRWEVQGLGSSNPVDANTTAAGRAHNRRVEITLQR
jgi:outer membrane protein OmpA-like peptidoglycan-associated protein